MQSYRRERQWRRVITGFSVFRYAAGAAGALSVLCCPAIVRAQGGAFVGKLNIVRDVLISKPGMAVGAIPQYGIAKQGQGVLDGQSVRTLKRSQAEVVFNDRSAIRISERTDLRIQDEAALRRIALKAGIVWVRVARGVNTQVETPSATAVARGTVFTVQQDEDGSTTLTVYEGTVELRFGDQTVSVPAGSKVTLRPGDKTPTPTKLPQNEIPVEFGGGLVGWWNTVADSPGLAVTSGTDAIYDLRTSLVGESGQQLRTASGQPILPGGEPFFISDPTQRGQFLAISQQTLVPDVKNTGLTLAGYDVQFGAQLVTNRFTFSAQDAAFLQNLGIRTVDDYIKASTVNGAKLNVGVNTSARSYYRPGSVTGQPNFDFRLLDRTESSNVILGIGAAAALLANYAQDKTLTFLPPQYELSGSAYAASPYILLGGRANLKGRFGKTRYELEGNLISLVYGDPKDTFSKLLSVAVGRL